MDSLLFGLTGFPLGHSFSAKWFADKFRREGIRNSEYINLPVEHPDLLPELFKIENLAGFNVTAPYKTEIMRYIDSADPTASVIGAVNCVVREGGRWKGYNTDWHGFMVSLKDFIGDLLTMRNGMDSQLRALVLGSGGAAQAAMYALKQLGICGTFVSRRADGNNTQPDRKEVHTIGYDALTQEVIAANTLIVNATPLGTHPNIDTAPNIPYEYLTCDHRLYDMVYNPSVTKFMHNGISRGASVINGQQMLELQAEESWRLFRTAHF